MGKFLFNPITGQLDQSGGSSLTLGTTAGTACEGNDSRLSDSRNANPHAASHGLGGSDEIAIDASQVTNFQDSVRDAVAATPFQTSLSIQDQASLNTGTFFADAESLTNDQTYNLPNNSGTLMLVGDSISASQVSDFGDAVYSSNAGSASGLMDQPQAEIGMTIADGTITVKAITENGGYDLNLISNTLTANRSISFPDASGTLLLNTDLSSYALLSELNDFGANPRRLIVYITNGSNAAPDDYEVLSGVYSFHGIVDDKPAWKHTSQSYYLRAYTPSVGDKGWAFTSSSSGTAVPVFSQSYWVSDNGSFAPVLYSGLFGDNVANATITDGYATLAGDGKIPFAQLSVGTAANTVAVGNDSRITGAAQKSANLSDLASASAARTALGLGTAATAATGDFAAASHNHAASAITSGVFDNARINFAAPAAIGNTTPSTGAFTSLSTAPAANTAAFTTTGYSLTGSNAQSLVDLAGTWNTTGTPSAIKLNITNTASNASSLLVQLQTGGTNRFTIDRNGNVACGNLTGGSVLSSGNNQGVVASGSTGLNFIGQYTGMQFQNGADLNTQRHLLMDGYMRLGWGSGKGTGNVSTFSAGWVKDDEHIVAQRIGTNAQEYRLYATSTSDTNYQRMTIKSVRQTLSALSGASATTTGTFIPDGAVVVGVTTRVATALTGATGYQVGDGTTATRWGDITGTAIGTTSDNRDWTAGTIECFTAGGNITLTAKTSNFTAGAIEVCVFYLAGEAD